MAKPDEYRLLITYADGIRDQFRFPGQVDGSKLVGFLEKHLTSGVISMQLEDRLLTIPTSQIRSVELIPYPEKMPDLVLRNVKRLS